MRRTLQTLTSRRYPEQVVCKIIYQILGTSCFLVNVFGDKIHTAYATDSELADYNPDAGYEYEHD